MSYIALAVFGVVCVVFSAMLNSKIYFAVRRHRNQIQALQTQQVSQNYQLTNAVRLKKSAVGVFYVYLVFLLCYLPSFCSFPVVVISNLNTGVKAFFHIFNYFIISQFIIKSRYLLLEDEGNSTRCHGHCEKYISKS